MENQPSLSAILSIPTSDQLDDWRDYLRFLVDNYGPEAAGPYIADLSVETLTPRSRQQSLDSGYHSPGIGDVDQGLALHLKREHMANQVRAGDSWSGLLDTQEEIDVFAETDGYSDEAHIEEEAEGQRRSGKEAQGLKMKLETRGVVGVSEVAVGGEISKKQREKRSDRNGYLAFGKSWGFR